MTKVIDARVLAIDPTNQGFAYAVLEGPERLVASGLVPVRSKSKQEYLEKVESLLWRYFPHLLVIEEGRKPGPSKKSRARRTIRQIEAFAKDRGMPVQKISRADVKFIFSGAAKNKREIAVIISRFFPELEGRLPRVRKPWMSEDERMNIFDAVSFALAAFRSMESIDEIEA
jgi:hypothetical protein